MSLPPQPPKPSKSDQPEDGKQNVLGKRVTPEAGFDDLVAAKRKARLPCWAHLEPKLKPIDAKDESKGKKVWLECQQCNKDLAPSNVSQISVNHFDKQGNCKAVAGKSRKASSSSSSSNGSNSKSATASGPMDKFIPTNEQQEQALGHLNKYLITRACPSHVEDPHLKAAFGALGTALPSRKEMCNKIIPNLYTEIKEEKEALIKQDNPDDKDASKGAIATDGWKKKACAQGTPLISANVLLPNGGSYFYKVVTAKGVMKDKAWIRNLHNELADELTDGNPRKLLGAIMDNTKANCGAMEQLENDHPYWLVLGCQSHAFNLLIKDLANEQKCPWAAKVFAQALTISNAIGDSEKIRDLVNKKQLAVWGKTKAFCVNVPHRFGTLVFVMRDVVRSKAPLIAAATDTELWPQATAGSTKGAEVHKIVAGYRSSFWEDAELLLKYCQPIMDAIHILEGDKPLLSQLRSVYEQIRQHFEAIMAAPDTPDKVKRSRLLVVVEERMAKHYKPCFDAAYVVDPINFTKQEGEWFPPVAKLKNEERRAAFEVIQRLAATNPQEEAALEVEWGRYRIQPLSVDVTGEGIMANLTHKTTDPKTNRVVLASVRDRRMWWANFMAQNGFPLLAKAARRLLAMHTTACAAERNWSTWGAVYTKGRNRLSLTLGEMIVFIRGNLRGSEGQDEEVLLRELYQMEPDVDGAAVAGSGAADAGVSEVIEVDD